MALFAKKTPPAEPAEADVRFCFDVAVVLRDTIESYRRLGAEHRGGEANSDLRSAAMELARRISAYERLSLLTGEQLASLSPDLAPGPALAVLRQLAFALVALSADETDEDTILTDDEVAELLRSRGADGWLERVLALVPEGWETL